MTLPTFRGVYKPSPLGNHSQRVVRDPPIIAAVHMTGNKATASMTVGIDSGEGTYQEHQYAAYNAQSKDGPSAHRYVARDGSYIDMIRPPLVAWSNGDLLSPETRWPAIALMVAQRAKGINPNQLVHREYELTGYPTAALRPTDAQLRSTALQIAKDAIALGKPIVLGETVILHRMVNTVNRPNCPFPAAEWRPMADKLIAYAKTYRAELERPAPVPVPVPPKPAPAPAPAPVAPASTCADQLRAAKASLTITQGKLTTSEAAREAAIARANESDRVAIKATADATALRIDRDTAQRETATAKAALGEMTTARNLVASDLVIATTARDAAQSQLALAESDMRQCESDAAAFQAERDALQAQLDAATPAETPCEELQAIVAEPSMTRAFGRFITLRRTHRDGGET